MRTLLDRQVYVCYGQIYVESDPEFEGLSLDEAFEGQANGLCGAAVPGALWLTTGLHTGAVAFTVEVHEEAPPLAPHWQEAVEVPFRPLSEDVGLAEWGGGAFWHLDLPVRDYRVRYCARGMDEARDQDTRLDGEPGSDHYLLQFWPAAPAPGGILRRTSGTAAYWHAEFVTEPEGAAR
ncbi:hypothetical protein ACIP5N_02290 [Streptomyces sp. NPDC088768]|uniref:hypothetical protein n=1 Tax=Streptomyces sp. NPDC088768 TaxID=3365894 RepID=UPI00382AE2BC